MTKKRVGLIGLGTVGTYISNMLLPKGYELCVWDISEKVIEKLKTSGAVAAGNPRDLAEKSDIILLSLPTSDDVEGVILGENGLLDSLKEESIVIDMSTVMPSRTVKLARKLNAEGKKMLDAPITFGSKGMEVFVGGPKDDFRIALEVLETVAHKVTWVGESGQGHVVKLVQNMISAGYMAIISEAIAFAVKNGADPELTLKAIETTGAGSGLLDWGIPFILGRNFECAGELALHLKDIKYMLSTGEESGSKLPLTSQIHDIFEWTAENGDANWEQFGIVTWWEKQMGIEVKRKSEPDSNSKD